MARRQIRSWRGQGHLPPEQAQGGELSAKQDVLKVLDLGSLQALFGLDEFTNTTGTAGIIKSNIFARQQSGFLEDEELYPRGVLKAEETNKLLHELTNCESDFYDRTANLNIVLWAPPKFGTRMAA